MQSSGGKPKVKPEVDLIAAAVKAGKPEKPADVVEEAVAAKEEAAAKEAAAKEAAAKEAAAKEAAAKEAAAKEAAAKISVPGEAAGNQNKVPASTKPAAPKEPVALDVDEDGYPKPPNEPIPNAPASKSATTKPGSVAREIGSENPLLKGEGKYEASKGMPASSITEEETNTTEIDPAKIEAEFQRVNEARYNQFMADNEVIFREIPELEKILKVQQVREALQVVWSQPDDKPTTNKSKSIVSLCEAFEFKKGLVPKDSEPMSRVTDVATAASAVATWLGNSPTPHARLVGPLTEAFNQRGGEKRLRGEIRYLLLSKDGEESEILDGKLKAALRNPINKDCVIDACSEAKSLHERLKGVSSLTDDKSQLISAIKSSMKNLTLSESDEQQIEELLHQNRVNQLAKHVQPAQSALDTTLIRRYESYIDYVNQSLSTNLENLRKDQAHLHKVRLVLTQYSKHLPKTSGDLEERAGDAYQRLTTKINTLVENTAQIQHGIGESLYTGSNSNDAKKILDQWIANSAAPGNSAAAISLATRGQSLSSQSSPSARADTISMTKVSLCERDHVNSFSGKHVLTHRVHSLDANKKITGTVLEVYPEDKAFEHLNKESRIPVEHATMFAIRSINYIPGLANMKFAKDLYDKLIATMGSDKQIKLTLGENPKPPKHFAEAFVLYCHFKNREIQVYNGSEKLPYPTKAQLECFTNEWKKVCKEDLGEDAKKEFEKDIEQKLNIQQPPLKP